MEEIKILCRHCALKVDCSRRPHKETYENDGWTTYCTLAKPIGKERADNDKWKAAGQKNARRR